MKKQKWTKRLVLWFYKPRRAVYIILAVLGLALTLALVLIKSLENYFLVAILLGTFTVSWIGRAIWFKPGED